MSDKVKLPIFRKKLAYCLHCFDRIGKKMILLYPFIPRRNTKAPEYVAFRKSAETPIFHFRFHSMDSECRTGTTLIYRRVRKSELLKPARQSQPSSK